MDMKNKKNKLSMEIVALQSAFFVTNVNLSDKLDVANKIKRGLTNILDGDPTVLPVPNDAPLEIPRIILTSKNKTFTCNIAPERIDFVINKSKVTETQLSVNLEEEILKNSETLADLIVKSLRWRVHRLALISRFRYKPEAGVLSFMKNLLSEEFGDNSAELEIHKLRHLKVDNFKSNHWVRFLSQNSGTVNEFVLILSDINTLKTEKYSFNEQSSNLFFSSALKTTKETLEEIL